MNLFKKISQAKGQTIMDKLLPLLNYEEEKPLILAKVINYSFKTYILFKLLNLENLNIPFYLIDHHIRIISSK